MDKMVKLQGRVYKMEVNNKVLIITDMNQYNEKLEKLKSKFGRDNIINIKIDNLNIIEPFDEIMRSIIISVYTFNIETIYFLENNSQISYSIPDMPYLPIIDYHFKNCSPELFTNSLKEWYFGNNIENSVAIVKNHPLLPKGMDIIIK